MGNHGFRLVGQLLHDYLTVGVRHLNGDFGGVVSLAQPFPLLERHVVSGPEGYCSRQIFGRAQHSIHAIRLRLEGFGGASGVFRT